MTTRIRMNQTRRGEAGALLLAGSEYTVADALAAELVGAGYAVDIDMALQPGREVPVLQNPATGGLVGAGGATLLPGAGQQLGAALTVGQSTAWEPTVGWAERFACKLLSGTGTTQVTLDYSNDGATSAGQLGTFDLDVIGQSVFTQPLMFPDNDSGAAASHIRFTVISGTGAVEIGRNV